MTQNRIYPSQKKYYANNPTVSFRLPKVLKEKLEKLAERGDMTIGQYVRHYLEGVVTEREKEDEIYTRGLEKGYKQGMIDWQIWHPCPYCDDSVYIRPMGKEHEAILRYFLTMGWGHDTCLEGKEKRNLLPEDIQTFLLAAQIESPKSDGKKDKEERTL
jgi:hypothetical protein